MIISHKHKFIFICNGKTGTTSIEAKIGHLDESEGMNSSTGGLWVGKHMPPAVIRALIPSEIWDSYFKFVFVRHPLSWFVSQYRWNLKIPRLPIRQIWGEPHRTFSYFKNYFHEKKIASKSKFDEGDVKMIANLLRRYRGYPGTATRYQFSYVSDINGGIIVDKIAKFESLASDLKEIDGQIGGVIGELPHLNSTKHEHYLEHLTEGAINEIRKIWAIDFENFGYE